MLIRKAQHEDIQNMMIIIKQAQAYFKDQGIDQWQDGYPNEIQLANDIEKGNSYVILNQGIIGTMYFAHEEDPNYPGIKGQWITQDNNYAVIHRIAVSDDYKGQGIAKLLLDFAVDYCIKHHIPSIRIDTHSDNLSMQRYLLKNGFVLCGDITLQSGAPRIAFEKIIS